MVELSKNARLLLKLKLLGVVRTGALAKVVRPTKLSVRTAVAMKLGTALAWVSIVCGIPLVTRSDFGQATELGRNLVHYKYLVFGGATVLMFYVGLFIGGNLIYELPVSEDERLLSYPIVLSDLVQFKATALYLDVLALSVYVILPFACLNFLALGFSTVGTVAAMLLTTVLMAAVCLLGINVLLSISKLFPNRGSESICITLFLVSAWLFAIGVRLYKDGLLGSADTPWWDWLNQQLSFVWALAVPGSGISPAWRIAHYILSVAAGVMVAALLVRVSMRGIGRALYRVHFQAHTSTNRKKRDIRQPSFVALNRYLKLLPPQLRALLIKDVLVTVRSPRMLVNGLVSVVFLVLIANWRHAALANPALFVLYFTPSIVISRLFLQSIGRERTNMLSIKQLMASISGYLSIRAAIACGVSLLILIPLWSLLIAVSSDLVFSDAVWRLPLLITDVVVSSLLVTWYSATFAEFDGGHLGSRNFGIHPGAMVMFWGVGALESFFFYNLDRLLYSDGGSAMTVALTTLVGLIVAMSTVTFRHLGIRRLERNV